jgi:aspartate kinase
VQALSTQKPLNRCKTPIYPLLVNRLMIPTAPGTVIKEGWCKRFTKPVIILKQNQVLLSISAKIILLLPKII